jgi:hypothetical protein
MRGGIISNSNSIKRAIIVLKSFDLSETSETSFTVFFQILQTLHPKLQRLGSINQTSSAPVFIPPFISHLRSQI